MTWAFLESIGDVATAPVPLTSTKSAGTQTNDAGPDRLQKSVASPKHQRLYLATFFWRAPIVPSSWRDGDDDFGERHRGRRKAGCRRIASARLQPKARRVPTPPYECLRPAFSISMISTRSSTARPSAVGSVQDSLFPHCGSPRKLPLSVRAFTHTWRINLLSFP